MDQRLPNPRQNNFQTSTHCLNRGMLLKMLVFCRFPTVGEDEERVGVGEVEGTQGGKEGGRERHGGVRWEIEGKISVSLLCFRQRKKIQIKRGRSGEKSICGRTRKVFVGGQERWPHIAGGRHSLLCNNCNVYACSTITAIVQKA